MKRAISMKCNQEQWDSIKDKLVGCEFIEKPNEYGNKANSWLTNNYNDSNKIGFTLSIMNVDFVHETWNEQVLLEACGIETEKIFKGSDFQFYSSYIDRWIDCSILDKYRLRPDHSKEIAELERQIEILKNK